MKAPKTRGYLMHLTHYDPKWCRRKPRETRFDLSVGLEVVEALADEGFNMLVIDCADGVRYRSHPALAKRYTIPMRDLRRLVHGARKSGLEIVPKLNFSRGEVHRHNNWMRYPREQWHENFDTPAYWRRAFGIIDELIHECRPERFFHIGMDEEEHRSYTQYVQAIRTLCSGLRRRGLKTVMWNDSAISRAAGSLFVEKARYAEQRVPRGVVQVLWNYHLVPRQDIRRIRARGLPLWGAPGRGDVRQARAFRDDVLRNGGVGLLMTTWMPCRRSTRTQLLASVRAMGSTYRGQN